jgi:hypothetical protein
LLLRSGWVGLVAPACLLAFVITTIFLLIRKPLYGDGLAYALAHALILLCLWGATLGEIFSFYCVGSHSVFGHSMDLMWIVNRTYIMINCLQQGTVVSGCVAAIMIRYKSCPQFSALDVLGMTAAVLSVLINQLVRDICCFS